MSSIVPSSSPASQQPAGKFPNMQEWRAKLRSKFPDGLEGAATYWPQWSELQTQLEVAMCTVNLHASLSKYDERGDNTELFKVLDQCKGVIEQVSRSYRALRGPGVHDWKIKGAWTATLTIIYITTKTPDLHLAGERLYEDFAAGTK